MRSDPQPTVLVFATGGTIGMHDTGSGLAPDPAFPDALEEIVRDICEPLGAGYRINHLLPAIDSANADADTAPRIARAVRARVRTQKPRGVVITHGTDTLAFTASRLAFELSDLGTPVVLTGSQYPYGAEGTDARDNLSLSIRTALRAASGSPACVAFGDRILPAIRTTKFDTRSRAAFRAERQLGPNPLGTPARTRDTRPRAARVLSFRFVPGVTGEDLLAFVGGRPDALVLECYGSGNAPTAAPGVLAALREITASIPVVAITQCALGEADLTRYAVAHDLSAAGVIEGADLTLEASVAKLGFLIDHGFTGAELHELMARNLIGEQS